MAQVESPPTKVTLIDLSVRLWDTASGRQVAMASHDGFQRVVPMHDGKRLAVSIYSGVGHGLKLYDISQRRFRLVDSIAESWLPAVSPDDKWAVMFDSVGLRTHLWNCETKRSAYTFPANCGMRAAFSPDGQWVAIDRRDAPELQLFDVTQRRAARTLTVNVGCYWPAAFSPDGLRMAAHCDDGAARIWDVATLRELCKLPDNSWVFWLFLGTAAAFLAWSVAWVRARRGDAPSWQPAVDVAVIEGTVFGVLLLRIASTYYDERGLARAEIAVGLGLTAALVMLLVVWAVLGNARWQCRLPGAIVSLAVGWMVTFALSRDGGQQWDIVVSGAAVLAGLIAAFGFLRSRGWSVVKFAAPDPRASGPPGRTATSRQFGIKDLAIWTASLALLFAVGRRATPQPLTAAGSFFLAVTGLELAVVIVVSFWTGLGGSRLIPRLVTVSIMTVLCGSIHAVCFRSWTFLPWLRLWTFLPWRWTLAWWWSATASSTSSTSWEHSRWSAPRRTGGFSVPAISARTPTPRPPSAMAISTSAPQATCIVSPRRWQYRRNQHRLVERMIDHYAGREHEGIDLVPAYVNLDCRWSYPTETAPGNVGSRAENLRQNNGVHPAAAGYTQIGDSLFAWLKSVKR